MKERAIDILNRHGLMAISTLRPDGWPQTSMVSYANEGLLLYFVVSRASQKFANIERDSRVSIAVGRDFDDPAEIAALSIAANASELHDAKNRDRAIDLLLGRHPGLVRVGRPDLRHSAVMRAYCSVVMVLDYSKGLGHADMVTVGPDGTETTPAREDDWGFPISA